MSEILMGPQTLIYPMPALLVGANVSDNHRISWQLLGVALPMASRRLKL